MKTSAWRYVQQRLHHSSGGSRPAFLIGCGRSGTSMLVMQLGRSWQLDIYNENDPAAFENWFLREFAVIRKLIAASHAPIVLFKPILETYRACLLLEHFPDAKMIFAFRHYNDVVNSSLKKFGVYNRINHVKGWMAEDFAEFADLKPPLKTQEYIRDLWRPNLSPEDGAAMYWLFQNRLFFDLGLSETGSARLVCYEEVVSEPDKAFAGLCDFLGVRFEPKMAANIFDSSVQKNIPPTIDAHIQEECDLLWQRLGQYAALQSLNSAKTLCES